MTHRPSPDNKSPAVVISKEDDARAASSTQPSLHALLSNSPLRDLEFGGEGIRAPVRGVVL
jgi:hypothetical protein